MFLTIFLFLNPQYHNAMNLSLILKKLKYQTQIIMMNLANAIEMLNILIRHIQEKSQKSGESLFTPKGVKTDWGYYC